MQPKIIITCAVTGNLTTREHHPDLPVTLSDDGRDYDAVATARLEVTADAA